MTPDAADALSSIDGTVQRLNDLSIRNNGIGSLVTGSFFGLIGMLPLSELGSAYIERNDLLLPAIAAMAILGVAMVWSLKGRSAGKPPPTSHMKNIWPHLFASFVAFAFLMSLPKIGFADMEKMLIHRNMTEFARYALGWMYAWGVGAAMGYFIWLGRQWAAGGVVGLLVMMALVWLAPDARVATLWLGVLAAFQFALGAYLAKSNRLA